MTHIRDMGGGAPLEQKVEAGHLSFEHARLFLFECFPGAEEMRERYRARYAGESDDSARIDDTELLLLDEDPLEDISHTTRIHAVIFGGALFQRSDLDELLTCRRAAS
ncbi:MAG: hypothetical protein GY722_01475 [bacterium]|nr:hypothetical protein [bacterium]